jgi:hypothetical protein
VKTEEIVREEKKEEEPAEKVVIEKQIVYHHCSCNHPPAPPTSTLDLDEKIRRIRQELNLLDTTAQDEFEHKLHHKHTSRCRDYSDDLTTKYAIRDKVTTTTTTRTRSKSADRLKSKSKSPTSRPPWRPTGSNDYTSTYLRRADLILNNNSAKNTTESETKISRPQTSHGCYSENKVLFQV